MVRPTPEKREEILSKSFGGRGLANLRLVTLEDGPTRGQRVLEMRTAHGLEAEIAVDRGFDLAALRYRGINIGWVGPSDYPAAIDPEADAGLGLLRSFQGFLVTCGLDHHGLPAIGPADHFNYPNRKSVQYPLHGRISAIPAVLERREVDLEAPEPHIICVGLVRQVALFGEVLELRRVIRMPIFSSTIHIEDTVTNRGSTPVRHGILYHLNVGYPMLDTANILGGIEPLVATSFNNKPPIATPNVKETFQATAPTCVPDASITLANPALGLELAIKYDASSLPGLGLWRAEQSGIFALGIEPHSLLGSVEAPFTKENRDFLLPGERRNYSLEVILSSNDD
ncbi:MAG: DUF4432 family protein [Betaproteobacteria bacterium]